MLACRRRDVAVAWGNQIRTGPGMPPADMTKNPDFTYLGIGARVDAHRRAGISMKFRRLPSRSWFQVLGTMPPALDMGLSMRYGNLTGGMVARWQDTGESSLDCAISKTVSNQILVEIDIRDMGLSQGPGLHMGFETNPGGFPGRLRGGMALRDDGLRLGAGFEHSWTDKKNSATWVLAWAWVKEPVGTGQFLSVEGKWQ